MVKSVIAMAAAAALAMTASAAALPAATSPTTFSFAQWVEDILSHPDTALTVDEAIAGAHAASIVGSAGGLQKRANCNDYGGPRAPGRDAAACVDYLARLGGQGYTCGVPPGKPLLDMCVIGGARIFASQSNNIANSVNCNDMARTAGLIFDSCWRADDTVAGGEGCINSPKLWIALFGI